MMCAWNVPTFLVKQGPICYIIAVSIVRSEATTLKAAESDRLRFRSGLLTIQISVLTHQLELGLGLGRGRSAF